VKTLGLLDDAAELDTCSPSAIPNGPPGIVPREMSKETSGMSSTSFHGTGSVEAFYSYRAYRLIG